MITTGKHYFSQRRRSDDPVDLLVVGGGITGCGVALDAAERGLSVMLVEQHDLSSHTSSRSSKLVHGGIRYLEQFDFALVRESLKEQDRLLNHIAPYHVSPLTFTMPIEQIGLKALYYRIGTILYDWLGSRKAGAKARLIGKSALKSAAAYLHPRYGAGLQYSDALMDDVRLVFSVAHTAVGKGATLLTRAQVTAASKVPTGFDVTVNCEGTLQTVTAKNVVLAAGAYSNHLQKLFGDADIETTAAKGSHILVQRDRLPGKTALVTKTPKSVLFCIPFPHHWVIGTTDAPAPSLEKGEIADRDEITYILTEINQHLADPLEESDVIGAFAGVRPLVSQKGKDTSAISRSHVVIKTGDGAILVTGGKYTTYRVMAEDAVNAALEAPAKTSVTAALALWGAEKWKGRDDLIEALARDYQLDTETANRLVGRYGNKTAKVLTANKSLQNPLEAVSLGGPLWAELYFGVSHEGATSLADLLHRRVRCDLDMACAGMSIASTVLDRFADCGISFTNDPIEELETFKRACAVLRPDLAD